MSNAIAALGTLLQKKYVESGTGASSGFSTIAEIKTLGGPSLTSDTADVTSHDSATTASGFEEAIVTILRSGEVTFGINYIPTEQSHGDNADITTVGSGEAAGLLHDYTNKLTDTYKIVFPDAGSTEWSFTAYVTGFEPNMDADTELDASVTLKPTGKPTLA